MYKVIKVPENGARADTDGCPEVAYGVLNRVVQAIRGYPDGKTQWWLCRYEPLAGDYDTDGPYYSRAEAEAARAGRLEYGVFGPYRAQDLRPLRDEAVPLFVPSKPRIVSAGKISSRIEKVVI